MAYIPVNPERRDPGFFKKKAEIGLPNVDNMSAAEFVTAVSEDIKILNNKKKTSSRITRTGEFYGGILKTAPRTSHVVFTLGLFDSLVPSKELASVHVDFAFSCNSADEPGHINYTIRCPDEDPYLKDLYLVFSQVQDQLYVSIHSPNLPDRTSQNYFNLIGVNFLEWTEGIEKLNTSKDISEIVKNHELVRVRLTGPCSTVGSDSAEALSVYDESGKKVFLDNPSSLEGFDYPSINGVPFIGKKGLLVGNEESGRHITVPALHKDSTLEGAGPHDWEVLDNLKRINLYKSGTEATPKSASRMPNSDENGYGLVKPSRYKILPLSSVTPQSVASWLDHLGEDTDVITVGAFKEYMSYLLKIILGSTVDSYNLYLENSEDLFKYTSSGASSFNLPIHSFKKSNSSVTRVGISIESSEDWLTFDDPEEINGILSVNFSVSANQTDKIRTARITITQDESDRVLNVVVIQALFEVKYGILLGETPIFEDTNYSFPTWSNEVNTENIKITPIKSDLIDQKGYTVITNYQEILFTNTNSWIEGIFNKTSKMLSLSVEANNMSYLRTGTIYFGIIESSGDKIRYIPIKCSQSAVTSSLSVDDNSDPNSIINCSAGKDQVTKRFKVTSNYPWLVSETSIPSWITLSGYTGERPSGTSYLTVVISENNTQSDREAELKIESKGGSQKIIKIIQKTRTVYIDINNLAEDQFFSFNSTATHNISSVEVKVSSNVNWFIDQCPSWIVPSRYDGGEQGKVTTETLKLSMPEPEGSTIEETVSLAYYDESTKTIQSLRKIIILPSISGFNDSDEYVLPQTPLSMEVTSEGGNVTVGALSNVKYKAKFTGGSYVDMVEYNGNDILSEDPKPGSKLTYISFEVSKNESPTNRDLKFVLIPESDSGEYMDEGEFPEFTVFQPGNKEVTPIVYEDKVSVSKSALSLYVHRYSGKTVSSRPASSVVSDRVYESSYVRKGQVILLPKSTQPSLYRSTKETTVLGDTLKYINSVVWGDTYGWYIVSESGYFFSGNGKFEVIDPISSSEYVCTSKKNEFNLTLLSVMNNCWDVYNDTIPGWISLEKISGTSNLDTFKVIIDENTNTEDRSFVLQFNVDSLERTINSFSISQTGLEIVQGDKEVIEVLPVFSSWKTSFKSEAFDLGLSALVKYSSSVTTNEVENTYSYSEYKTTGVVFSVSPSDGDEGVYIGEDSLGNPKLIVSANEKLGVPLEPRTITVTATYDGKSGSFTILQGSTNKIQYYSYGELNMIPDFEEGNIPLGISRFGFKIRGSVKIKTVNLENGSISEGEEQTLEDIKFPYLMSVSIRPQINNCGLGLESPKTLVYYGDVMANTEITYPTVKYTETGNEERVNIKTKSFRFIPGTSEGSVTIKDTLMSGNKANQILSTDILFSGFPSLKIEKTGDSSYIVPVDSIPTSITGPKTLSFKLNGNLTEYLSNQVTTLKVTGSGKTQKYIHFRYTRSHPEINCKTPSVSYDGKQTTAEIPVSSNIGYNSSSWSNNSRGVKIEGGTLKTSEANLGNVKTIRYISNSQPSRKWYQKYSTESLILKDSDNYGITKEVPIVLPIGVGSTPGIEIIGEEVISKFTDTERESSYDVYIPYEGGKKIFNIRSYDSYTITKTNNLGGQKFDISGLTLTDKRTWIQSMVGSLGEMILEVEYNSRNSGTSAVFRGSVVIKSSTRKVTINIYQTSMAGIVTIDYPKTKALVLMNSNSNDVIRFNHVYPSWQIVPLDGGSYSFYPKFNGQDYSASFGGGNSATNQSGYSSVRLAFGILGASLQNMSLELKPVSECITSPTITTPNSYGIKTASPETFLTGEGDSVQITDSFDILVCPRQFTCDIYQKNEEGSLEPVSELKVTNTLVNSGE